MSDDRPNLLFIFTDQQTLRTLSCRGSRHCHTPYLDQLAARGVRFERSYCAAAVCGPSRAALVTGCYPHEVGVDYNSETPSIACPTFGERLRRAGYHTVWVGKWHLPTSYPDANQAGQVRGFDFKPLPPGLSKFGGLGSVSDGHNMNDAIFQLRWNLAEVGRPWSLTVSLHNPHDICAYCRQPAVPHANIDRYPPLPDNFAPPTDEAEFVAICRQRDHYGDEQRETVDWDEAQWRAYLQAYYRFTEQVDWQVGRILAALEAGGWAENTIVVFTSDHGEGVAGHGHVVKLTLYEEAATVPLIVAGPGLPAGVVDEAHLVSGIDIAPTLCDFAGVRDAGIRGFRGRSLRPLLAAGGDAPWRDYLAAELAPDPDRRELRARMIRTERWKSIACSEGERPEMLFDLEADPGETANLAGRTDLAETLERHRGHLREWIAQTNDTFALPAGSTPA